MKEFIIYNNKKYYIQSSGRYFSSGDTKQKPRLLHRKIWFDYYGEIPKGYVVHHKDHNWRNNKIENLELVEMRKHLSDHAKENYEDEDYKKKNKEHLLKAQEEAKKWHKSEEGREWHKEHAIEGWEQRETSIKSCSVCKKEFDTYFATRKSTRFCSTSCAQKEGYKRYFTEVRKCTQCDKEFLTNRHRKVVNCSRKCGAKARWT